MLAGVVNLYNIRFLFQCQEKNIKTFYKITVDFYNNLCIVIRITTTTMKHLIYTSNEMGGHPPQLLSFRTDADLINHFSDKDEDIVTFQDVIDWMLAVNEMGNNLYIFK